MEKSEQGKRVNIKWQVLLIVSLAFLLVLSSCTKEPDVDQMKADLLGRVVDVPSPRVAFGEWKFASMSEFQELTIRNKKKLEGVIEYEVNMLLQDLKTGKRYLVNAVITYRNTENKWQIASITPTFWEIY